MHKSSQILIFLVLLVSYITNIHCKNTEYTRTKNPSIIIVGAGASAIAAASMLLKNNITNIKIFEAEDRIGGRIHSIKLGEVYADIGAEFCHGEEDNKVFELVKDYDILQRSNESATKTYFSNGEELSPEMSEKIENFTTALGNYLEIENCKKVKSFGECLDICFDKFLNETPNANERAKLKSYKISLESDISGNAASTNLHDLAITASYKDTKGHQYWNWDGHGYKTILDILIQKYPPTATPLPIHDKIFLNKKVVKISGWDLDDSVNVTCEDGTVYTADQVLFSPSLGVLKADHLKLFDPRLPDAKVEAIQNLGYGVILKIFLILADDTKMDYSVVPLFDTNEFDTINKNLKWLTNLNSLVPTTKNSKVIQGWYGGTYIPEIETLSDEEIAEGQKYIIDKFLHPLFNVTMPEKIIRTRWLSNSHFRGTYSYESANATKPGIEYFNEMAEPLRNKNNKPTVSLIGEATNAKHYSTVHGAIESGFREAQRIVDNYITYNK